MVAALGLGFAIGTAGCGDDEGDEDGDHSCDCDECTDAMEACEADQDEHHEYEEAAVDVPEERSHRLGVAAELPFLFGPLEHVDLAVVVGILEATIERRDHAALDRLQSEIGIEERGLDRHDRAARRSGPP